MANLEKIEQQIAQLKAKRERMMALDAKKKRAEDTRKKVVIGAALLQAVKNGNLTEEKLLEFLADHLTREHDRKLFNLPPKM